MRNLQQEASSNSPVSEWAKSTIDTLSQRSPTSLHVSLSAMRATMNYTRYHAFQREYELATHFMRHPDFENGVRARLIERRNPTWSLPAETLSQPSDWVSKEIIQKGRFNEELDESFYMLEKGRSDHVTEERGLFRYSLPMEVSVLATLMKGKIEWENENAGFTRKELVDFIVGQNLGKAGLERKLNFILDMKTVEDETGKVIWKFEGQN
jgi:3-hydroxyisobutyryl-CoA hydrolase